MEVAWDRAPPPYPPPPVTDWALHGVSTQSAGLEYIPSSAYSTLPPQPVHHHIYSAPALATTLDAYANVPRVQYVDPNLSPVTPNADTPVFPVPLTSSSDLMPSTAVDWDRVKFSVCETDRQRTFNQKYDMLYPFQKEVFCRSVSKGSIIFMPTGAGKTIVAAAMAAYHHALHPSKRIVFIVNRVPLVSQQALVLNRFGLRVAQICGDKKDAASWSQAAEAFDAVVIIDALLIEYITRHSTALFDDVSLMVFDEIHHARKSSNYAKLLQLMGKSDRPHVLGLSASPSARESVDKTRKALEELMGLTRCQIVCVLNEREDLAARVSTPQTNLVEFSPNRIERCLDSVIKIAINAFEETIVPMIRKIDASMAFPLEACLGFPHGSPQYIVKAREAQTIYLQQGQASYATVANHLQALHQALILLEEWSACDAASFLLTHPTAAEVMPSSEEALHDLVAARVIDLEAQQADCTVLSALRACSAPLYVCICQMIHLLSEHRMSTKMKVLFKTLEEIVGNEEKSKLTEFRGIVFCETKAATVEITTRLAESPLGKILHPTYFVGHGRTLVPQLGGRSISMNDTQQQKALRAFREGDTKLLIATSVAEEGLDIPMCNVVIRYEGVFSVQSFIQSRGRARKSNSQFVVISKMSHSNPFADVLRDCMVQNDVVEAMSMANQDAVISATERNNEPMRVFEADPIKFLLQVRDEHQANVLLEERSCRGGVEVTITVSLSNGTVVRGVGLGNQQRAAQEARLRAVQQLYKLGYIRNDTVVSSMALSGSRELKKFRYFTNPNVALSNTRGTKTGDTSSDAQPNITGYDQEHWGSYVKPYVLLDRHLRDKGFEAPRVAMAVTDPTQPVDPINSIAVSIQFQMRAKSAGSGGDVKWFFLSDKGPTWESALQNTALLALRALGVNIVSKPHTRWDE